MHQWVRKMTAVQILTNAQLANFPRIFAGNWFFYLLLSSWVYNYMKPLRCKQGKGKNPVLHVHVTFSEFILWIQYGSVIFSFHYRFTRKEKEKKKRFRHVQWWLFIFLQAHREGYIAIVMPKPGDWPKVKESLLSLEEYKKLRGVHWDWVIHPIRLQKQVTFRFLPLMLPPSVL